MWISRDWERDDNLSLTKKQASLKVHLSTTQGRVSFQFLLLAARIGHVEGKE